MRELRAELALDAHPEHGEGPMWDDRAGWLYWVDITGMALHRLDPATGVDHRLVVDQQVGAVALCDDDRLLLAVERGLSLVDPTTVSDPDASPVVLDVVVAIEQDDDTTRANDGAGDPFGRYWIGTMAHDGAPGAGSLYRVDPGGSVTRVLSELAVSNGIAWSRDGATAWFVDSPTRRVDELRIDPETGAVLGRRPHIDLHDVTGVPDGMTVDVDGGLWIAMFGGWQVRHHDAAGRLDAIVSVPVAQPTACVLGGPGLDELWITTSPEDLDPGDRAAQPHAGALFRCVVEVPGHPPDRVAA